jgi:hypothetical protein
LDGEVKAASAFREKGMTAQGVENHYEKRVCSSGSPYIWLCVVDTVANGTADLTSFIRSLEHIRVDVLPANKGGVRGLFDSAPSVANASVVNTFGSWPAPKSILKFVSDLKVR